ncbi:MAG: YicC/YloC family endoribonuclease [Polyangiales bacterium]
MPSVLSMTGFGAGEASAHAQPLRVELRAVNHRHLDLRVRTPSELGDLSGLVEESLRARCGRGRIEAQVLWRSPSASGSELDFERARRAYQQLTQLRDELAPGQEVPFTAVFGVPGVFASKPWQRDDVEQALRLATEQAIDALTAMRAREGEALAADIRARLALVRKSAATIEEHRPSMLESAQKRLTKRVEKLLEGSAVGLDPARLVQEAAWFAEKSDVAEELTRLASHLDEFERSLSSHGESVGRKLDFVVQEIGRELNTIGSKANDADVSRQVVELKAELERIREQVQNIL